MPSDQRVILNHMSLFECNSDETYALDSHHQVLSIPLNQGEEFVCPRLARSR
jgi:hypothetical protein